MLYNSTQNAAEVVSAAQAIAQGISKDGGLFVPQEFPKYSAETFNELLKLDYKGRAKKVFADFLSDFTEEEINDCVENAYTKEKFGSDNPAPLAYAKLNGKELNILELWHGPTCAFKDMALQILPHFLTKSLKKTYDGKDAVILVATSGDTGKAALEGFKDVDHTKIIVFYPVDGVSPMQKHQMNTQEGNNVTVCAIKGNFDDAQTGVKKVFGDTAIAAELAKRNIRLSSANSINWGRLVPQIVYYFSAYCDMIRNGRIKAGDKINFVVPTGNFGNILAAYYAREMGLPVDRLICASNKNRVLTDFFDTGVYDINRSFYTTSSPSMDILISSNLERLLFIASGYSDEFVREMMGDLKQKGKYTMPENVMSEINSVFCAGCCDDEGTKETIKRTFEDYGYLCDTHTAVGINVYEKYAEKTGDKTPTVIDSTANPFKFSRSVLDAVEPGASEGLDEFSMVGELARVTKTSCPPQLADLRDKPVRFRDVCDRDSMEKAVFRLLGI